MKNKFLYLLAICIGVVYVTNSCKEVDVLTKTYTSVALLDTTFVSSTIETADPKVVVLEEFTGVRCINCAVGHTTAASIKSSNPGRVVAIALHSYFLDEPYPYSFEELTSEEAQLLSAFIGPVSSKPSAAINRKLFAGESSKILDLSKWNNKVNDELAIASPVNITLSSVFNAADTSTLVTFTAHFTQAVSDPLKFTMMLSESDIETAQLMPTNDVDTFYIHDDVLRDVTTNAEGDVLGTAAITPGRVFIKQYRLKLDHEWNPDKMHVVAFIHKSGTSYEILQAAEILLK